MKFQSDPASDAVLDVVASRGRRPLKPSSIQALAQIFERVLAGELPPAEALHALGLDAETRKALRDRHVKAAARLTGEVTPWGQAAALSLEVERLDWRGWKPEPGDSTLVTELISARRFGAVPVSDRQLYRIIAEDTDSY